MKRLLKNNKYRPFCRAGQEATKSEDDCTLVLLHHLRLATIGPKYDHYDADDNDDDLDVEEKE